MILSRIIGGLGNQMFQYAAGKSLAVKLNADLKLDIEAFRDYPLRKFELDCFKLNYKLAAKDELKPYPFYYKFPLTRFSYKNKERVFRCLKKVSYLKESHCELTKEFFNLHGDIYLDGYWNSEQYFNSIEKTIRQDFKFKNLPHKSIKPYIEDIENNMAVSLHVRRGDYVSVPKTNKVHGLCELSYYKKAINIVANKVKSPVFYVFSDDKEWVKENIKSSHKMIYVNHGGENYEDLRLMSLCKHHIIANSTFSWWGAWLNADHKKIVISPKRWFQDPNMNSKDICPSSWVKI